MIGTRIRLEFNNDREPREVEVSHYAVGRIARWARANGMVGLSPDTAESLADQVLCIQLSCWAEVTRGQAHPVDFDEWVATVADFSPVEGAAPDPTQSATSADK